MGIARAERGTAINRPIAPSAFQKMKKTASIDYQPMILPECPDEGLLRSREFRRFLMSATIESGLRFFMARQRVPKTWLFLDTKFNPNTGSELPTSSHDTIHTWMLGRGVEALTLHLEILDGLEFTESEKAEARSLFYPAIRNMCAAIREIAEKNHGRIPFKVGRDLRAVGSMVDPAATAPADLFCGKGLLVSAEDSDRQAGLAMLQAAADRISKGRFDPSPDPAYSGKLSQAMRMLFLSVPRLLLKEHFSAAQKEALRDLACDYMEFVMDRHFDKTTNRFSEWIDPGTGERGHLLDPGHCTEFVGLAFSAIRSMDSGGGGHSDRRSRGFQKANAMLPQILFSAFKSGFNPRLGGSTRRSTTAPGNRSMLPCQAGCGKTGAVLDRAPAVPEGDPLYHTNRCALEILRALEGAPPGNAALAALDGI